MISRIFQRLRLRGVWSAFWRSRPFRSPQGSSDWRWLWKWLHTKRQVSRGGWQDNYGNYAYWPSVYMTPVEVFACILFWIGIGLLIWLCFVYGA